MPAWIGVGVATPSPTGAVVAGGLAEVVVPSVVCVVDFVDVEDFVVGPATPKFSWMQ